MRGLIAAALALLAWGAAATPALNDGAAIPHLPEGGRDDYYQFVGSPVHRAFAIAPGGGWAWASGKASAEDAAGIALDACQAQQAQACMLYALDDRVVFDAKGWSRLWGPYATAALAARQPVGTRRGQRFPNLAFRDADGRRRTVADLRGKVTVLHFWGSWCGPCRREMPELERLRNSLVGFKDIGFTLLQVRETLAVSAKWTAAQNIGLPLCDSGSAGESDPNLLLAGGAKVGDREIAKVFPTTYVLDKHGLVLFSHIGPVRDWSQYREFLIDAAKRSGK